MGRVRVAAKASAGGHGEVGTGTGALGRGPQGQEAADGQHQQDDSA